MSKTLAEIGSFVTLQGGDTAAASGGSVYLVSGSRQQGASGPIQISSGESDETGDVSVDSGDPGDGSSILIATGDENGRVRGDRTTTDLVVKLLGLGRDVARGIWLRTLAF